MITTENHDSVMLVKLDRGVTNALNLELVNRLAGVLQEAKGDNNVHGLVLAGSNDKFFSIGFDIPRLIGLEREDFMVFYRAFNGMCLELYTFPKPTAAAITGHATAGGCILALCCDYRFIADGRKLMGLNEIHLGVPVPYLADCILRSAVGDRNAREIMESGDFYPPGQSLQMGMVDKVLPLEHVMPAAMEKVASLGRLPLKAFGVIKGNRVETAVAQVMERRQQKEEIFLECWYSHQARQRLKEAMEKFKKKGR